VTGLGDELVQPDRSDGAVPKGFALVLLQPVSLLTHRILLLNHCIADATAPRHRHYGAAIGASLKSQFDLGATPSNLISWWILPMVCALKGQIR